MARIKQTAAKKVATNTITGRKAIKTIGEPGRYSNKGNNIKSSIQSPKDTVAHRVKLNHLRISRFAFLSIPKRPFQNIVRDISHSFLPNCKFQSEALYALQQAAEDFLVGYFEDGLLCQIHAKRRTLMKKDLELVRKLRKIDHWAPLQSFLLFDKFLLRIELLGLIVEAVQLKN